MSTRRSYQSRLREERARETKLAIRRSARELFEEQGFTATTVAQIAARAGVAVPTVYAAFDSKSGIVRAMMDELEELAGGEEAGEVVLGEEHPELQLRAFVHFVRTLFERGAPVLRAAMQVRDDEDVRRMAAVGNERRLEGCRLLVARWGELGALAAGVDAERGAKGMWLLTSAEQYFLGTDTLGWSADEYETWLHETLSQLLLTPR